MFRWFLILLTAGVIAGVAALQAGLLPALPWSTETSKSQRDRDQPRTVKVGEPLFPRMTVEAPTWQSTKDQKQVRAIISDCQFEVIDKQDVTSIAGDGNKNGLILFVGEEVLKEDLLGNDTGLLPAIIKRGPETIFKKYRRWKEGDIVKENQMLAMIDPSIALTDKMSKEAKIKAAYADWKASEQILTVYGERVQTYKMVKDSAGRTVISSEDYINTKLTRDKYEQEVIQKREAITMATHEYQAAEINCYFHEIRCKLPGESIIKYIYKNAGEGVKNLEPILQLYNISKLRAQGSVEAQYFGQLREGQRVILEPSQEVGTKPLLKAHQGEITGVAVCADNERFVTGSEDKKVCVWRHHKDQPIDQPINYLLHSAPVRSVACAPKNSAKSWCVVGCADGSIYLWDLGDGKTDDAKLVAERRGQHRDSVTALAFSPDGTWFASGGNDGQLNLWQTSEASLVYPFDAKHGAANGHQGPITSLHFTPQTRLVSASRDQSLRVWDLHTKGVKLHGEPITGRGAAVNQLGVSQDGQWMLFDQGKTLQILSVDTGRTLSELKNPINAPAFETLALFSPDGSLMLTAGANEGRLQLWRTPTPRARGFEVRQLVTTERSPVTCAAFSPNAGLNSKGFAVTGTKEGYVYVWANPDKLDTVSSIPTQEELQNYRLGDRIGADEHILNWFWGEDFGSRWCLSGLRLTLVDRSTDAGKIRIGVDLENPQAQSQGRRRFIPGQRATVVVVD